jgi:hypothetical protein
MMKMKGITREFEREGTSVGSSCGLLVTVKKLQVDYDKTKVFSNLSFEVCEGDFICIVGQNGAGKSTLIKTLLGQIKQSKGEILFHNLKRNFIGYMPQESKVDKNFPASVSEIVYAGTLNRVGFRPFFGKHEKNIVEESLKELKIINLAKRHFADLSGGQRQKVLLARALAATSKLLILDEPSNNLDFRSKMELYENLSKLNKKGITILMVTHDLDHKNLIGNKILALSGEEYFFGETKEYVERIHDV